uniref:Synaptobrevin, longin-like domain protein n=1 Tax=Tanacetum cinerariifolium TaxID=118510 RepID=A0A699LDR8_TANCI|nr:hypothetical protein [Tanacetum cinerariifolium]
MVAILEKSEHNVDFHPIVDFVEASPLRFALTIKPIVYVSHIQQFWSTARIETTKEGTKILATVDGILSTITESSLRRNLKLQDEEGISYLPDAELFENLTLMGYNISPNQKFTFQKGQFSHQWKYLIHTIMQCLSPKSTGFNEFISNIATTLGEVSGTPTEPHHTPSPKTQHTSFTTHSSPTLPPVTTTPIPTVTSSDTPTLRHYTRRARIAQSSALPPGADEPASPLRDVSQGEAFPTDSGFEADQDRANIAKTSTLPYDSAPRVTSPAADEGTTVLASGVAEVPTGSGSIPSTGPPAAEVPTGSDVVPTAGLFFATVNVVTPYIRRKGKETMVESETLKKKKIQEHIDIQMARQLKEEMERYA